MSIPLSRANVDTERAAMFTIDFWYPELQGPLRKAWEGRIVKRLGGADERDEAEGLFPFPVQSAQDLPEVGS